MRGLIFHPCCVIYSLFDNEADLTWLEFNLKNKEMNREWDFSCFCFCSQQKLWATGGRTLRTRQTGKKCLRLPKGPSFSSSSPFASAFTAACSVWDSALSVTLKPNCGAKTVWIHPSSLITIIILTKNLVIVVLVFGLLVVLSPSRINWVKVI